MEVYWNIEMSASKILYLYLQVPLVLNLNQPSSHYQVGFKIGGKDISQLCYSADSTLIVENIYDLIYSNESQEAPWKREPKVKYKDQSNDNR